MESADKNVKPENFEFTPFIRPLKPLNETEFRNYLKQLEGRQDKIIRTKQQFGSLKDAHEKLPEYLEAKKLFNELREKYNIESPKMEAVVGELDYYVTLFIVVDKIEGRGLLTDKFSVGERPAASKAIDGFYAGLIEYYTDKYKNGGNYLSDLRGMNFMYGHKAGEKRDRPYVVDVDPYYAAYDEENRGLDTNYHLFHSVISASAEIGHLEYNLGGAVLEKSREKLQLFCGGVPRSDPYYADLEVIRRVILGDSNE